MSKFYLRLLGLCLAVSACGETVNYATEEKLAAAGGVQEGDASASNPDGDGVSIPGDGSESGEGSGGGHPNAGKSRAELCATLTVQTQNQPLVFPELESGRSCAWGQGEMLSKRNGWMRAYDRQEQSVSLPAGAVLCGFEIAHEDQAMRYDDEMFFLLNNKVLLATRDYTEYFHKTGLLYDFSWAELRDKPYDNFDSRPVYCVGQAEGLSACQVPPTETSGRIELSFTPQMSEKLADALEKDQNLKFEWITTGDNDASDCRHSDIEIQLGIRYVMP